MTKEEQRSITELAKQFAPEAIKTLREVMLSPKSMGSARVSAAQAILDRGIGRPVQQLEHTGKDGGPIVTEDASMLSPVEREQRLLALQQALAVLAEPSDVVGQVVGSGGNGSTKH